MGPSASIPKSPRSPWNLLPTLGKDSTLQLLSHHCARPSPECGVGVGGKAYLSWVPWDPTFSFFIQKSGELCRYTSSESFTGLISRSLGTKCLRVPIGRCTTFVADR